MKDYISSVFGASPVGRLQQHSEICFQCAERLVPLFEAVIAGQWCWTPTTRAPRS